MQSSQNKKLCRKLTTKTFNLVVPKIKTWMPLRFLFHTFREWTLKVRSEQIHLKVMTKLRANLFPVCWSVDNRSRQERPNLTLATRIFFLYVHVHIFKASLCYSSSQIRDQMLLFSFSMCSIMVVQGCFNLKISLVDNRIITQ